MTRFTVVWDDSVERPFINAWVEGDSNKREILTEVANWVDANLAEEPNTKGQALPDQSARVVAVPVSSSTVRVSATFQIFPDDRRVRIVCLILRGL